MRSEAGMANQTERRRLGLRSLAYLACLPAFFLDCWTLESGTNKLSQNIGNKLPIYVV